MANELAALVEVAADAVDRLGITPVQTMHQAIARRVFANTPGSAPTHAIHDRIATATYAAVRGAVATAARAGAAAARTTVGEGEVRSVSRSAAGRLAMGVLNGVSGDRLAAMGNDLAVAMAVRSRGADVECTAAALRSAFPAATPRIVVFLHGLAETEQWWARRERVAAQAGEGEATPVVPPFGIRLEHDCGFTPVYVRYNTGLRVRDNGRHLAALLDSLVAAWPEPVEELVLVGHSMGGLVVRAACHGGTQSGQLWPQLVGNLVTLGAPHHGAPGEKAIHLAARALRMVPESTPFADILDLRSAGIRDMRFGPGNTVPLLAHCRHTFITATVTRDPHHPAGWLLGDLLVRTESAAGRRRERTIPVPPDSVVHLGGLTHFDLLDHPAVYDVLRSVIAPPHRLGAKPAP